MDRSVTRAPYSVPSQMVILCGGMATRLGEIAADTPKPLLEVGGRPFLELLIRNATRYGCREFVLLAGHLSPKIAEFAETFGRTLGLGYSIEVAIETKRAGTAGAVRQAIDRLHDRFFLSNGDSFQECDLVALSNLGQETGSEAAMALRTVYDTSRYGRVKLKGALVTEFCEKSQVSGPGEINAGIYCLERRSIESLGEVQSLEKDVLPALAARGQLAGLRCDGPFIDIGLPETLAESRRELLPSLARPAIFLDRDGVLNEDVGHCGSVERLSWTPGAVEAVRMANDRGFFVFVVTNQAGIAKGKYSLEDYWRLRRYMHEWMIAQGARIDDERFCPYHPNATEPEWRADHECRKPRPGMILDLIATWPIKVSGSFLIGDQPTDLEAAQGAGIPAFQFTGGNLAEFLSTCINSMDTKS